MSKNKLAKFLVILFSLMLFVNTLAVSADSASISVAKVDAQAGEIVVIPITLQNCGLISGINFTLSYDTAKLSFIESAFQTGCGAYSPIINNDTVKGIINYAWDSAEGNKNINGSFITFQFKVAAGASVGSIDLNATVKECYRIDVADGTFKVENVAVLVKNGGITVKGTDSIVSEVITAINNIGTVTYDTQSLARINDAANKYLALTYIQKQQVTNFDKLLISQEKYTKLESEYKAQQAKAEADIWRSDNDLILAKTVENLTLADKPSVIAALDQYVKLSTLAKAEVIKEKNHLNILNNHFVILEKVAADASHEEELRNQAKQVAEEFRDSFSSLLSTPVDKIYSEQNDYLVYALSELDNQIMMNPYVEEYLVDEKAYLEKLLKAVQELIKTENPEESKYIIEANEFKLDYSYVLFLSPENVTYDDALEIRVALAVLDTLDDETQKLLKNEKAHLENLEAIVENLSESDDKDDGDFDNIDNEEEKDQLVVIPESQYPTAQVKTLRVISRQAFNPVIWILFCILAVASLATVGLWVFYLNIKKGKELDVT